jgi:hypothetical protein
MRSVADCATSRGQNKEVSSTFYRGLAPTIGTGKRQAPWTPHEKRANLLRSPTRLAGEIVTYPVDSPRAESLNLYMDFFSPSRRKCEDVWMKSE